MDESEDSSDQLKMTGNFLQKTASQRESTETPKLPKAIAFDGQNLTDHYVEGWRKGSPVLTAGTNEKAPSLYSFENKNAGNNYNSQGHMSQASFGKLQEQPSKPKPQIPKVPKLDLNSTKTQKIGQSHPNLLENSGANQSPDKPNLKTLSSRRSHGTPRENDYVTSEIHQQLTSSRNTYYKEEEGLHANSGFLNNKEGTQPVSQQNSA